MRHAAHMIALTATLISVSALTVSAQKTQSGKPYESTARQIITTGLASGRAYDLLRELSDGIGPRLSGSAGAASAVQWASRTMGELGFDSVWTEPAMVPHWVRGNIEEASVLKSSTDRGRRLRICALGGSIATPAEGITAEIVRVTSFEELKQLGEKARGKIVFFDRPMDRSKLTTGEAYGGAVNQRTSGAVEAGKAGGVAALVRSMTTRLDTFPHTGAMHYEDSVRKVPTAAVSTLDADFLDTLLSREGHVTLRLRLGCETLPDVESSNVIGELKGTEKPEEVVLIGGHLDSWDKGRGAHDDGAGCVHSIEALRLLHQLGLKPKRTIRAVLFMNEENGLRGGKAYAEKPRPGEKHIMAIETDAGGFTPRGFGIGGDSTMYPKVARWSYLFEPIDADEFRPSGGGADISELARRGVPTMGLRVDGHRYFDYHHSDLDTFDKVNERELELGAACLAIISYVLASEGLDNPPQPSSTH